MAITSTTSYSEETTTDHTLLAMARTAGSLRQVVRPEGRVHHCMVRTFSDTIRQRHGL